LPGEPLWAFAYTNGHGDGHSCSVGNAHSNGYCDGNRYCIANTQGDGHTTAASYGASSTVSLWAYMQLSSGTREAIREFPKSREFLYRRGASGQG
jgi:hypothetical protein